MSYILCESCLISSRFSIKKTTRIPTEKDESNVPFIDLAIQRQAAARATMMWQMLNPDLTAGDLGDKSTIKTEKINDYRNWEAFANRDENNQVTIKGKTFYSPSIESWHDGIHVLMGTGSWYNGGMPVFDPIASGVKNPSSRRGHMGQPRFAAVRMLLPWIGKPADITAVRSGILPASLVSHAPFSPCH